MTPLVFPPLCALLLLALLALLHAPCASSHPQPCQVLKRIGHTVRVGALHVQPRLLLSSSSATGSEDRDADADATTGGAVEGERRRLEKSGRPRSAGAPGASGSVRTRGGSGQRGARNNKSAAARQRLEESASRESHMFAPRDSVLAGAEALNRAGVLPYNLTLELVMAVGSGLGELPSFSYVASDGAADAGEDPLSFLESVCHTVVVQGVSAVLAFPRNRDEMVKVDFLSVALQVPVVSVVQREFPRHSEVRVRARVFIYFLWQ